MTDIQEFISNLPPALIADALSGAIGLSIEFGVDPDPRYINALRGMIYIAPELYDSIRGKDTEEAVNNG